MTTPEDQEPVPEWKRMAEERVANLAKLREAIQQEKNRQVLEWMDTQPPEIKDISIGKQTLDI